MILCRGLAHIGKNNRREELEKITDAELKYLESQMREEGGDSFSDFSGVSVELLLSPCQKSRKG